MRSYFKKLFLAIILPTLLGYAIAVSPMKDWKIWDFLIKITGG